MQRKELSRRYFGDVDRRFPPPPQQTPPCSGAMPLSFSKRDGHEIPRGIEPPALSHPSSTQTFPVRLFRSSLRLYFAFPSLSNPVLKYYYFFVEVVCVSWGGA
eukprot:Hpha_TRINITY_DN34559_c0_g1::TRINITY_DN34559_c0_g1_i1::g.96460::m.96460